MATIKRFEDLEIWQLRREYCKEIYKITRYTAFSKDFDLVRQIRKSTGSIMDNIAEGFGRGGNNEFRNFLSIALGSVSESRSQLYRAYDQKYINQSEIKHLLEKNEEICNKTGNLISYLKSSDFKGIKFMNK